jgi:hypothetical protein
MMKLQDVLLKAMAKKITWWDAAEIIGVTDRTMRRWRERLEEHGYDGLVDRRKGRPSPNRVPLEVCQEVLRLSSLKLRRSAGARGTRARQVRATEVGRPPTEGQQSASVQVQRKSTRPWPHPVDILRGSGRPGGSVL